MGFSQREKTMLKVLLQSYPDPVSINRLERVLEVSRRTVYRELNTLKTSLSPFNIDILHQRGRGYGLAISDASLLDDLNEELSEVENLVLTNDERQRFILFELLYSNQPLTTDALAYQFDVSVTTVEQDIQKLEDHLTHSELKLQRQTGVGTFISGSEYTRQQLATMLAHNSVNELTFFKHLEQEKDQTTDKRPPSILKQLNDHHLILASQVIHNQVLDNIQKISDTQLMRVIIGITILLDRLQMGEDMDSVEGIKRIDRHIIHLSHQITAQLSKEIGQSISIHGRHYIALLLAGINYKETLTIFHQDFDSELVYQVKQFIRAVSEDTGNDYRQDGELFDNLFTHMQAALRRPINLLDQQHFTVLEDMRLKYPDLYHAVEVNFKKIFQIESISQDELTYFVLHFATSLEKNPQPQKRVTVLVICSSGIGTSKILESKLKQNIPEIANVYSAKISDLPKLDFEPFDLILSTVYLEDFEQDYLIISPLLKMTELEKIQQLISQQIGPQERLTEIKYNKSDTDYIAALDYILCLSQLSDYLVHNLQIKKLETRDDIQNIITEMIANLPEGTVNDRQEVAHAVIRRYDLSPIGLPQTSMGLFHASTDNVLQAYFGVFDLTAPVSIQAMDGGSILLKRILLLLAPEPMDAVTNRLLSAISRSLIENDLYSHLYETGDEQIIKELLSEIFIEEIHYYIKQKGETR